MCSTYYSYLSYQSLQYDVLTYSVSLCLRACFKKYSSLHISSVKTGLWTSIYPKLVIYNQIQISVWPLLDRRSLLHKQPFITAHFKSSLHLYVHHCTLKQALLCLSLSLFVSLSVSFSASVSLLSLCLTFSLFIVPQCNAALASMAFPNAGARLWNTLSQLFTLQSP